VKKIFFLLFCFTVTTVVSQGIINNGAKLIVYNNNYLHLNGCNANYFNNCYQSHNGVLENNGLITLQGNWLNNTEFPLNLMAGAGCVVFNGNSLQSIMGNNDTYFSNIHINNANGIFLNTNISVSNNINFINGCLDLRDYIINLGMTGCIYNETENNRIKASDGINEGAGTGSVFLIKDLSAGNHYNISGSGIDIFSKQNIGLLVIERKHSIQYYRMVNSISREYHFSTFILPVLPLRLRMHYFDNELSGNDEYDLVLWNSEDNGNNWIIPKHSDKNTDSNYIEKSGNFSMSSWTIGVPFADSFLPVELLTFEGRCFQDGIKIKWSTASETGSDYFILERSDDGLNFQQLVMINGAGNSNTILHYEYLDMNPGNNNNFYRLKQADYNGKIKTFPMKTINCDNANHPEMEVNCSPNPFTGFLSFNITGIDAEELQIKIFDNYGKIISIKQFYTAGKSYMETDYNFSSLNPGLYLYLITSGSEMKTGQIIKSSH